MVIIKKNTAPLPKIILTDKTPSLEFDTEGSMKLEIDVKFVDIDVRKCDVIIDCKASGIGNYIHKTNTETDFNEGILLIHLLNNCSGCTVNLVVTVHKKINGQIKFYPPEDKLAEAEIILKPTSKKKVGKITWDIKDNVESNVSQESPIANIDMELFGYNGEEIILIKNIIEKGKVVFEQTITLTVKKNRLKTQFYKRDCLTQDPNTEMTLAFQLFYKGEQLVFQDNSRTQKKDITLQKYQGVEKITSFPIQPVVVGTREIIDNTFHPDEQKQTQSKANASEESNTNNSDTSSTSYNINDSTKENTKVTSSTTEVKDVSVLVEIMDGDRHIKEDYIQFVNLPQKIFDKVHIAKWSLDFIDNEAPIPIKKYQLGRDVKYRVTLKGENQGSFKLYLIAISSNDEYAVYSSTEKERNGGKYKYLNKDGSTLTMDVNNKTLITTINKDTKDKIITGQIALTQAGGNKYRLVLESNDNPIAKSVTITTWRMFFFAEVKMKGLTTITNELSIFIGEYKKHFINLKGLDSVDVPHIKNIGNDKDKNLFKKSVQSAYSKYNKIAPYCVAIAYTDFLAIKDPKAVVDIPCNTVPTNPFRTQMLIKNKRQALWYEIDGSWFISAMYIDKEGGITHIKEEQITPIQNNSTGLYDIVEFVNLPQKEGRIELIINGIANIALGISFAKTNIVAISTREGGKIASSNRQNQIMIHEVAHQFGMVSDGTKKAMDRHKNFYNHDYNLGHKGSHCEAKVEDKPSCVMFGTILESDAFCDDCAKCLRRIEIVTE